MPKSTTEGGVVVLEELGNMGLGFEIGSGAEWQGLGEQRGCKGHHDSRKSFEGDRRGTFGCGSPEKAGEETGQGDELEGASGWLDATSFAREPGRYKGCSKMCDSHRRSLRCLQSRRGAWRHRASLRASGSRNVTSQVATVYTQRVAGWRLLAAAIWAVSRRYEDDCRKVSHLEIPKRVYQCRMTRGAEQLEMERRDLHISGEMRSSNILYHVP